MSDVVGRGVIELVADARKLKAGIDDAKKSIRTLGEGQKDISKSASASIDQYIGRLQMQQKTLGKSTREIELYKLAMRGASNEQLAAANSALRLTEAYQKGVLIGDRMKSSFVAFGTIAATGLIAAAVAFDQLTKKAGDFQDMAEKTGDSAENIASLAVAAKVGGIEMDSVVGAANKLTKSLTGVDDESKAAGAAIKALGLNIDTFKSLKAADQMETVAKALQTFEDGAAKSAVTMALFGKSGSEMLPFLNELAGSTGRQNILTSEQIRLADEYADEQARLTGQISLYAQAIAVEILPSVNDLAGASLDLIKGLSGVNGETAELSNNKGIQDFADGAIQSIAFVVDALDGLMRISQVIGKTVGGMWAIALNPIQESKAIFNEWKSDIDSILERPTLGSKVEDRIAARKEKSAIPSIAQESVAKPKLKFDGATSKSAANAAAQEAKARLAAELSEIKTASDATINTYTNAERIMEARRAAGILSEKEYYDAKRSFMALFSQEKEQEIQKEIARMQAEKLSGKEKIENDRKIAEAQSQLAKLREDSAADSVILAQKEEASNKKIAQSYVDAKEAADAYIQSVIERNKREIEGIGRGTKFRENQAGRNEIEDKFLSQRQALERDQRNSQITKQQFEDYLAVAQETYQKEIELYDARTQAINDASASWTNGATEAMQNYYDQARDIAGQTEDIFTNAFKNMEDALVSFVKTGKLDFKSLMDSIIADMARAAIQQNITGPLSGWMSKIFSGLGSGVASGTGAGTAAVGSLWGARASGGPVSSGGLYRVNEKGPELLNMSGNQYLMMGNQSGSITPNHKLGGVIQLTSSPVIHIDSRTDQAEVRALVEKGVRAGNAQLINDLQIAGSI